MDPDSNKVKKLKNHILDNTLLIKNCITCTNVPEELFDVTAAKKHFSKFGRVQRIRLFPKRQMCMVQYDQLTAVDNAILNAGAFDGFMFDVTRTKPRMRKKSKREDDPDWVPDSDVEEELSAMGGTPTYRPTRQKPMELDLLKNKPTIRMARQSSPRKKVSYRDFQPKSSITPTSISVEAPVSIPATQTNMSTSEAAAELVQLKSRISLTPDEQWRTLDARDRILRAWGGAGARVKIGGATIGTCPDMCPEKERLHRQAEHQVMNLECVPESDGQLEQWRAVKQYSRSSADQEMPMCYELRPASVLMRTCRYLLHEVADTKRQISLADWFHFLWDRFRGIRKDITQQALCCSESICLVEMCARFHAHCAARLADLEYTQFDQKLNTDNLTKCLQTLKHMYADVERDEKPRESEFRGYVALLNLGDSNFWWEIKQLPEDIQKSKPIMFAIKVFNALDNNNYIRFFRLVREEATYLQACILLRYFNDVRARALARIVKAYAPRGGSRYPAEELLKSLAFETLEAMYSFVSHYGLRNGTVDENEPSVILNRHHFIEDSDPYPLSREFNLIESKNTDLVGNVIAGGPLPEKDYLSHNMHSSFYKDGTFKEGYLLGENLGYNTINDTNKDIENLKVEVEKLSAGSRFSGFATQRLSDLNHVPQIDEIKTNNFKTPTLFDKPLKSVSPPAKKLFLFKPAIAVASTDVINRSPDKIFDSSSKNSFSFSKPQETISPNLWTTKNTTNSIAPAMPLFGTKQAPNSNLFSKENNENKDPFKTSSNVFKSTNETKNIFNQINSEKGSKSGFGSRNSESTNLFNNNTINKNIFLKSDPVEKSSNIFVKGNNLFTKADNDDKVGNNIFTKSTLKNDSDPKSVFGSFKNGQVPAKSSNLFSQLNNGAVTTPQPISNGDVRANLSPASLFKSVSKPENYFISQNKNNTEHNTAASIFHSAVVQKSDEVYDFAQNETQNLELEKQKLEELRKEQELILLIKRQEEMRKEQLKRQEELKKQEEIRKLEELRKQEEIKKIEEKIRKEQEEKQEQILKKMEAEKKLAEEIKLKSEQEKIFREKVEKESTDIIEELLNEINSETVALHMKEELNNFTDLITYSNLLRDEILTELCNEICIAEMKADMIWTRKLLKKWFSVWKNNLRRNIKRRSLLHDTPVWITDTTPDEQANLLRRAFEKSVLKNMHDIHRGYRFTGELNLPAMPEPYNILEITKSSLLKRMKQIKYPCSRCLFWKLTIVSPGQLKWFSKKIEIQNWLLNMFSDKKEHVTSDTLIHVSKQSWNNAMELAMSVSLIEKNNHIKYGEAIEGTNGLLICATETDDDIQKIIDNIINQKYNHQIIPIAVILPQIISEDVHSKLVNYLDDLVNTNVISAYKIFIVDNINVPDSLNMNTKSAMKWLAKKYPSLPPIEIDYLKSICKRYMGSEFWYRLKLERDTHFKDVLKDLRMLVQVYNTALNKLTDVITDENLFGYPPFPLELKEYLNNTLSYPRPIEFIPSNAETSANISAIKSMLKKLHLPEPHLEFYPSNVDSMRQNVKEYCNQIGWFSDPEQVICKVVSVLPELSTDENASREVFTQNFEQYDLIDLLNIIVSEKIKSLRSFDDLLAIYDKNALDECFCCHWWYELDINKGFKHKALDFIDDIDYFIEAKRKKISQDSFNELVLQENDCTMVEQIIKVKDEKIKQYNSCEEAVKQLEKKLEDERRKAIDLENLLRTALLDV